MTSAQTLSNHTSFANKQKPHLLSEHSDNDFNSTKSLEELETLPKVAPQRTLRSSAATKMTLRTRDQTEQSTLKATASQTSNDSRKSDANLRTSSENLVHKNGASATNRASSKWEKMSEETSAGQFESINEPQLARKISEEDGTINTTKNPETMEDLLESEENKSQNDTKKSLGDILTNQQSSGYHLRSAGHRSGNRDTNFSEYFEYEYPGRNASTNDGSTSNSLNSRTRTSRGQRSANTDNAAQHNGEATTQRGGNGQRLTSTRSTRNNNAQNAMQQEDISNAEISEGMPRRGKASEKNGKSDAEGAEESLNCPEELEEMKDNLKVKEPSDSMESSTRSPSAAKGDVNRRRGRKCFNKLCLTDHNNMSLWTKEKVKGCLVCKACMAALRRDDFCHFCSQIYFDDDTLISNDDKEWIQCGGCKSWTHIQCEATQGLRNIVNLSRKSDNYEYYCPRCRAARNGRRAKTSLVIPEPSNSPTRPSSPKQAQPVKRAAANNKSNHLRPPLDDWLACEEGLEEPAVSKVRVTASAEVSVSGGDERIDEEEEDLAKKRLDSLFARTNVRRRVLQWKASTTSVEGFSELDKLMNQYGNKKMQLTEQEIKADLNRLRDLLKAVNGLTINSGESNGSDAGVTESGGEDVSVTDGNEKTTSRNGSGRGKQTRKPARGKERASTQNSQTNGRDKEKIKEVTKTNTLSVNSQVKMQLRVRKM